MAHFFDLPKAKLKSVAVQGDGSFELDVSRFHAPVVLVADCPTCGKEVVLDFRREHLSFPVANTPTMICMTHVDKASGEIHDFNVSIVLKISIEAAP